MSQRSYSLPVVPELARHPDDGWRLADPAPLGRGSQRALRGLIDALLPPAPAPRVEGVEDEVALHVRRMLQYMPVAVRLGFVLIVHVIDWSPLWRFRGFTRIQALSPERACARLDEIAHSSLWPVRLLLLAPKACILSTYFDRDEVHEALGYDPRGFMRERVLRRRQLLAEQHDAAPSKAAPAVELPPMREVAR